MIVIPGNIHLFRPKDNEGQTEVLASDEFKQRFNYRPVSEIVNEHGPAIQLTENPKTIGAGAEIEA